MLVENLIVNMEQRLWYRCRFIVICIEEAWETGATGDWRGTGVIGLRAGESSERRAWECQQSAVGGTQHAV